MIYNVTANIRTVSAEQVSLVIDASSVEEAKEKATAVLHLFPEEGHSEEGVLKAFIDQRNRLETLIGDVTVEATRNFGK